PSNDVNRCHCPTGYTRTQSSEPRTTTGRDTGAARLCGAFAHESARRAPDWHVAQDTHHARSAASQGTFGGTYAISSAPADRAGSTASMTSPYFHEGLASTYRTRCTLPR